MASILSRLLIHPVPQPSHRGKIVRFDVEETDILFATGTMEERVVSFIRNAGNPVTVKEIAVGIASNPSRVTKAVKLLVKSGKLILIEVEGCVREYALG